MNETARKRGMPLSAEHSSLAPFSTLDLWPSLKARVWVEDFISSACSETSIVAVVLLGSIVRPVDYASDVDILYIYNGNEQPHYHPPLDVDIRGYKQTDIGRLLSEGHELLSWAILYGYLVCERGHFWTTLREEWLQQLPLPSAEIAEERATRATRLYNELSAMGDKDAADEMLTSMLTHQARACLIRAGAYPASRPELPDQLRSIGKEQLAAQLDQVLERRRQTV